MNIKINVKKLVISSCLFLIITNIWIRTLINIVDLTPFILVINSILLIILECILYKDGLIDLKKIYAIENIKRRKILIIYILFIVCTISMSIYNGLWGNLIECFVLVLCIPFFTMKYINKDIFQIILKPTELSFVIFVILSIMLAPETNLQYRGILINPNATAVFMVFVFIVTLYGVIKCNKISILLHIGFCSISVGYIFFIESRAAEIVVIAVVFLWLIHFNIKKKNVIKNVYRMVSVVIVSALMCICVPYIHNTFSYVIYENVFDSQFTIYDLHSDRERIQLFSNHEIHEKDMSENRLIEKREEFTSGRMDLWKAHIEEVGILGHSEGILLNNQVRTAHNTYISMAYVNGIFSGILLLFFNIGIGILSIRKYIKDKSDINAMLIITIVMYGMYSVVETMYYPLTSYMVFLFYIAIIELFQKSLEKRGDNI